MAFTKRNCRKRAATTFSYDNVFQGVGLKEHLEVEIKSCDLPDKRLMFYPADKRVIKPITTAFLESIGQEELISVYGLESFVKNFKTGKAILQ